MIEFLLIGIPLLFVLISIFEIARGMWLYVTVAHAVREGTRFAIVHGNRCASGSQDCGSTVGTIAARMRDAGVGLVPGALTVTMASPSRTYGPATLQTLLTNNTPFPAFAKGITPQDPGADPDAQIRITATYPFASAICMFWPGAGATAVFPAISLPAQSQAGVQF